MRRVRLISYSLCCNILNNLCFVYNMFYFKGSVLLMFLLMQGTSGRLAASESAQEERNDDEKWKVRESSGGRSAVFKKS